VAGQAEFNKAWGELLVRKAEKGAEFRVKTQERKGGVFIERRLGKRKGAFERKAKTSGGFNTKRLKESRQARTRERARHHGTGRKAGNQCGLAEMQFVWTSGWGGSEEQRNGKSRGKRIGEMWGHSRLNITNSENPRTSLDLGRWVSGSSRWSRDKII